LDSILSAINGLQQPSTQPSLTLTSAPDAETILRAPVQVIRGGAESVIYYDLGKAPEGSTAMLPVGNGSKVTGTTPQEPPKVDAQGR
jgi:hypothetical protein